MNEYLRISLDNDAIIDLIKKGLRQELNLGEREILIRLHIPQVDDCIEAVVSTEPEGGAE